DGAEPIAGEPVPGQGSRLRQRRQLRGGRGHGAGPGRVAAERHHGSTGERAAQLPARLVQGAPQRHRLPLATRLRQEARRSAVLGRRDRRERLQLRLLTGIQVDRGHEGLRATGHKRHNGRRQGSDRARRDPDRDPGELPDRVLPELPLPLRRVRRPRRPGLPQELQRLRPAPQRAAPGGHRRAEEGQHRRHRRVRGLLRRLHAPAGPCFAPR
ncbi:hypothetical protein ACJX0J_014646, partial [Zea mays]